ncbi:MAG: hypothetical protein AMXMBFR13_50850 [Phycisphaerae bacterium]
MSRRRRQTIKNAVLLVLLLAGLYWSKRTSYLLFHSLAELFSVLIAASIFVVAWNSRRFRQDNYSDLPG